jgi:hypothetical protein
MQAGEQEPEQQLQNECTRPKLVTAACIIWIIEGCFYLFMAALLVIGIVVGPLKGDSSFVVGLCMVAVSGLFGCVFVYVSVQTYRGKARDTFGNSMGSLALGLFFTLPLCCLSNVGRVPFKARTHGWLLTGAPLLTAGILALVGRTRYKAWRGMQNANRAAEKTTQAGQS